MRRRLRAIRNEEFAGISFAQARCRKVVLPKPSFRVVSLRARALRPIRLPQTRLFLLRRLSLCRFENAKSTRLQEALLREIRNSTRRRDRKRLESSKCRVAEALS